jgi:hypothetical protein
VRDWPWTARPAFQRARASWAWNEAMVQLLRRGSDDHRLLGAQSERAVRMLNELRLLAKKLRADLDFPDELRAQVEEGRRDRRRW